MNDKINEEINALKWLDKKRKDCYFNSEDLHYLNIIYYLIINLHQENVKLISENEGIKNIKYKIDEVIYKSRIYKAINYICSNCILSNEWEEIDIDQFIPRGTVLYKALSKNKVEKLLNILKGEK